MDAEEKKNQSSVYVIDEQHRLVYFNQTLRMRYPHLKIGEYCYQGLCGESCPCQICPLSGDGTGTRIFYNKVLKCWIKTETGQVEWPGKGKCSIIVANSIREKDSIYHDLNDISTYDELYDLLSREREHWKNTEDRDWSTDPLTGLLKRNSFFRRGEELLREEQGKSWCMVVIDIEHFKLFNDWYGQAAGDKLLVDIGICLRQAEERMGGVGGYMGGDDFAILMPDDTAEIQLLHETITDFVKEYGKTAGFLPVFGIYEIDNTKEPISAMYDCASIAMASIKGNYTTRFRYYDKRMKQRMEEDHLLLSEVQRAIENREFAFYAQPKCNLKTGKIVGLESLVRWNHPERGVIHPGNFLPLLESSGLITDLDLYIWEDVCQGLRGWLDKGRRAIPISVNVSRVDIYSIDIVKTFQDLTEKYRLDPKLIEIEITESAYAEAFDMVISTAEALRSAGFTVLMDDFGSGYSSLNMLKNVSVDILKIDMQFLDFTDSDKRNGVSILEAITRMANIMGLRMIAEGVETKEQIDFLLNMGCLYGQGFYFYEPMSREEMESLLLDESVVDFRGLATLQPGNMQLKDLLNETVMGEILVNNILGCVAFYDVYDGKLALLRANENYCAVTGSNMVDLQEQQQEILQEIYIDDRETVMQIFDNAYRNPLDGAWGIVRRRRGDGTYRWMDLRVFFLQEREGHRIYYGALNDVTEQKHKEQQLLLERNAMLSRKNEELYFFNHHMPGGYYRCSSTRDYEFVYVSDRFLEMLDYTREDIRTRFDDKFFNMIHPDDRQMVRDSIKGPGGSETAMVQEYRILGRHGYLWGIDQSRYMEYDGTLFIQGIIIDVSESVQLRNRMQLLIDHLPDSVVFHHYDRGEMTYRMIVNGLFRDGGCPTEECEEMLNAGCYQGIIVPEDVTRLKKHLNRAMLEGNDYRDVVRIQKPDGTILWARLSAHLISRDGEQMDYLCVYSDITAIKQTEKELWMANRKEESILRQAGVCSWEWDFAQNLFRISGEVTLLPDSVRMHLQETGNGWTLGDFPETLFQNRKVPKEYETIMRKNLEQIRTNVPGNSISFKFPLILRTGGVMYLTVVCETLWDENGVPVKAVGYYHDIDVHEA